MARVLSGERTLLSPSSPRSSGASIGLLGVDPTARAALDRLRGVGAALRRRLDRRALRWCSGSRACCLSTRPASRGVPPDLAFNTAISFVTNTNWQAYSGESTMAHADPSGRPGRPELRLGRDRDRDRRRSDARAHAAQPDDDRQLLGRPYPLDALHPPADRLRCRPRPRLAGRHPDVVRPGHASPRSRAQSRRSPSARSRDTRRSRTSAPTAAGRSTPTRRIRSRARTGSRTGSRSCCCC